MAITASEARRTLFPPIEQVNKDAIAVEITSKAASAVLISLAEHEAFQETASALRSPANGQRLRDADAALRAGRDERHELDRG